MVVVLEKGCLCCCVCCLICLQTANIPAADLLYVNYNNLVEGLLPYSVVLDAARRCVVVAIRGSLSVEDCVTGEVARMHANGMAARQKVQALMCG